MDLNLTGRRALVTGSSSGLGVAIAELLAEEGADVVVHGRDETRTRAVAGKIGAKSVAIGDLATEGGAAAVADAAGDVDVLVNNAGAYEHRGWTDATPEEWTRTYEVNVVSAVRLIRLLVPGMRARGWGRVIQIGGGLSGQPTATLPQYTATLAARHNLAVSLARELKDTGVTSNVVAPGAILVDAVQRYLTDLAPEHGWGEEWPDIERNAARDYVPNDIGRFGRPEEIAGAVAYLASPYADYVSGATLRVDGGTIRSVA
ncbi:SDR family NAD(P)-dependent oxidoreductase [Amycolatopsis sp. FDAARGOS 1241]|uniref:SDR family NAD(P)-dependent oxidoreductase n=1 Tax=Amycolatopsis sp. FDAARGOS 1241 TaxID=2778070 RepID=UPI00194E2130|nr:SDR family NAD(P)-dependent oxidoreductase [Amycolatopsis sp. FDAARGOS 1241]QRP44963.1 SDR family NAD(P)-dependent oxidoreductase [Amycolatopsis sp. FDAARGOS 1241]